MPTLVRLGNIKIQMFADDHAPTHFHVRTPTSKAIVTLADLRSSEASSASPKPAR